MFFSVNRTYFVVKLILFICFLTIVYQYLNGVNLPNNTSNYDSQKFPRSLSIDKHKHAPFDDILGIASDNVAAYSNGNDSYVSHVDSYLNKVYMGIKWQCVEYARRWTYLRKGATFQSVIGASDIWNQIEFIQRVEDKREFPLKKHSNGSPNLPLKNSYLIYPVQNDMPFGHVAVIVEVLPNAIRIAEQNFYFHYWSNDYAREIPIVERNGLFYIQDKYEVYGWMEIIDPQQQLKTY